ncbi:MAG: hypothetical protein M3082_11830 [Candidatus Dormibacteraeota bacterium]|nr:hypothetical protein [Candidatus Dormibacteraeota bacterium]
MLWSRLPVTVPRINSEVVVREVKDKKDVESALQVLHEDWPAERLRNSVAERTDYLKSPLRRGGLVLACLGEMPVGAALWRDSADGRCAYLTAAVTLPPYQRVPDCEG